MKSWFSLRAKADGTEIILYDEIGAYGISAKAFLAELGALPDDTAITLRINSPGGSVFDAVAIYNALQRHPGPVSVWIDGIAASAASYIAMAGSDVVMPENAFLMIHDPSGLVMGTAEDMRGMAEALDKTKASLVSGYVAKSGQTEDQIAALMAKETWLDAKDALDLGFVDRLVEPVKMVAAFDPGRFKNPPKEVVQACACSEEAEPAEDPEEKPDPEDSEESDDPEPVDPAAIRSQAFAEARAVVELCALAGRPDLADHHLRVGTDLAQLRAELLTAKAESAAPPTNSHHPQPGGKPVHKPWLGIIARTFQ